MSLVFDSPFKVTQDASILEFESPEKVKVKRLLSYFDVEFTEDKTKSKHYPLDDFAKDEEELPSRVQTMANALWFTLLHHLEKTLEGHDEAITLSEGVKVGKVYTTLSNRFGAKHKENDVLPYLFIYKTEEGLELMSEINFGIEIY